MPPLWSREWPCQLLPALGAGEGGRPDRRDYGRVRWRRSEADCPGALHRLRPELQAVHLRGHPRLRAGSAASGGGDQAAPGGCLGLGSCEKACPFDAIHVIDGVARVDEEKCKACNKCVDICPRHIIALEPYKTKRHVTIPCSSHDKGVDARKVCDNGCIGCSLCAKSCPKEAITMVNNLAVIDYEKCIGCGICAQKCPRKLITVDGKVPEVKPAAPKAAPAAAVKPAAPAAEKPAAEAAAAPKAEAPAEPKE